MVWVMSAIPTPFWRLSRVRASTRSTSPSPARSTRQSSSSTMKKFRCGSIPASASAWAAAIAPNPSPQQARSTAA